MKVWSILILSNGNAWRYDSEEYPVPKSSMATRTPRFLILRRGLERVRHLGNIWKQSRATAVGASKTGVVKTVIGEIPAFVAERALTFAVENRKAPFGRFRDGALVTLDPGVERRSLGDHGPFIGGDGLGKGRRIHASFREGRGKQQTVFGDRSQPLHELIDRHVHFAGGLDREEYLLLEILSAAVPHEARAPGGIDDGWRSPVQFRHAASDAERQPVAPVKAGGMTACAGLRRHRREARIEIQLLAERGLGQRIGILHGKRDKYRTPIFGLHRVGVSSCREFNGNSTRYSDDRRSQRDIDKSDRGGDDGGADQA